MLGLHFYGKGGFDEVREEWGVRIVAKLNKVL